MESERSRLFHCLYPPRWHPGTFDTSRESERRASPQARALYSQPTILYRSPPVVLPREPLPNRISILHECACLALAISESAMGNCCSVLSSQNQRGRSLARCAGTLLLETLLFERFLSEYNLLRFWENKTLGKFSSKSGSSCEACAFQMEIVFLR